MLRMKVIAFASQISNCKFSRSDPPVHTPGFWGAWILVGHKGDPQEQLKKKKSTQTNMEVYRERMKKVAYANLQHSFLLLLPPSEKRISFAWRTDLCANGASGCLLDDVIRRIAWHGFATLAAWFCGCSNFLCAWADVLDRSVRNHVVQIAVCL